MRGSSRRATFLAVLVGLCYGPSSILLAAEPEWDDKKKAVAAGTPVLWKDPGDVGSRDLFWGQGSEADAPKPPFRFLDEDTSGTNPKVDVQDAAGVTWSVKFDEEVHAEVAASRIAWALGYLVDESYFVPSGTIEGARGLRRAGRFVGKDGAFRAARFEKRPEAVVRRGVAWSWTANPFAGTRELSGLILLNVLVANFDTKESNNNVLAVTTADGGTEDWYVVSDWGGTFGKMGGSVSHSKWDLADYSKEGFVKKVSGDRLELAHEGGGGGALRSVPLEHARWFAGLAGRLTDDQLRQAFRAAGAPEAEAEGFVAQLRRRIGELQAVAAGG